MNKLLEIIDNFSKSKKILVFGDPMLDRYLFVDVNRISAEAPVPVAKVIEEKIFPGGASNVAMNLMSLGVKVKIIGLIGDDRYGEKLKKIYAKEGLDIEGLFYVNNKTIVKTRVVCGSHQLIRIDEEEILSVNAEFESKMFDYIRLQLKNISTFIISDYAKNIFSLKFYQKLITFLNKRNILVIVDPTPNNFLKFKNSYFVKPNKKEIEEITGEKINGNLSNLKNVCLKLKNILNANIMVTLGSVGLAVLFNEDFFIVKSLSHEVYDVSGAGDTVIASFAAALSAGAKIREAAKISNFCASVVVEKLGTATCSRQELRRAIERIYI